MTLPIQVHLANYFIECCKRNDVRGIAIFLDDFSRYNGGVTDKLLREGLYAACEKGHYEAATLLIDSTTTTIITKLEPMINEGFFRACKEGHLEIVKFLFPKICALGNGNQAYYIQQAFNVAWRRGHKSVIIFLLSQYKVVDINITDIHKHFCHFTFLELCEDGLPLERLLKYNIALYNKITEHRSCVGHFMRDYYCLNRDVVSIVQEYCLL